MPNRKKMFSKKAIQQDLASLRAAWGLDSEDFAADYEDVTLQLSKTDEKKDGVTKKEYA